MLSIIALFLVVNGFWVLPLVANYLVNGRSPKELTANELRQQNAEFRAEHEN